ncbi:MAG: PQQ-binding-like beta-propeller repeat protein [bacterium]|nr:PQQ-binding-like beta-propeller repeat protein [bacterium]
MPLMKIKTTIIAWGVLFICFAPFIPQASSADWPTRRGLDQNGFSSETGLIAEFPQEGPNVLWRQRIGTGFSSITIADGKLFTMGYIKGNDVIFCFDPVTGDPQWTYEYPTDIFDKSHEGGPSTTPVYADGRVYALSRIGLFQCVDAGNGEKLWSHDMVKEFGAEIPQWGFSGSAFVDGGRVIIGAGVIAAFDAKTGDLVWKTDDYKSGYSTPKPMTIHGRRVLALFAGYGLVFVDLKTGAEISKFKWPTKFEVNACLPLLEGDRVFISSEYGMGSAMLQVNEDFSLKTLWETKDFSNHFNGSIWLDGYLYGYSGHYGRNDVDFRCVDAGSGDVIWKEPTVSRGSVLHADGRLIALTGEGELVLVHPTPEGFTEISRSHLLGGKCWTEPALSNKKLYMRNAQGVLMCVDLGAA